MRGKENRRGARPTEETPAADAARAGASTQGTIVYASLVLPCALKVFGTTQETETRRPLGDLLRRVGYL